MKVLIVGGTGNISTPITEMLISRGDDVTLVNRGMSTGYAGGSAGGSSGTAGAARAIRADRKQYAEFEAAMQRAGRDAGGFDAVIDMVCFLEKEAESAIRAFRGITKQYIFCSTVDVYTKTIGVYPVTEESERKPSPVFAYAFEKARCEERLFEAHARGDFRLTIIRPAATYREGGPVHTFRGGSYHLDRIEKGKPIIIHGDGTSIWSACHSNDVARAFVAAIGNQAAFGNAYHTTGEEWMTWDYYWECAAAAVGKPLPEVVHIPTDVLVKMVPETASWSQMNFQYDQILDNTKARRDLGFAYTVRWKDGIRTVVEGMRRRGGFEDSTKYPWYDRIIEVWKSHVNAMSKELKGVAP